MIAPTRGSCRGGTTTLELGAVLHEVLCARDETEISKAVVERVSVPVVHDEPARDVTVRGLPHQHGARAPRVRFRDLHPRASTVTTRLTDANFTERSTP